MQSNGRLPSAETPISPAPVHEEGPLAASEPWRPIVLAALTLLLVALCVYVSVPFLPALTWAIAVAIIVWPINSWMMRRLHRESVAAFATTIVVGGAILAGTLFVSWQIAREASAASSRAAEHSTTEQVRKTMERTPGLSQVIDWMDRAGVDVDRQVRGVIESYTTNASGLLHGSISVTMQFAVMLFILFHLLRDRASLLAQLRALLPMTRPETERVFQSAAGSVHANLHAALLTSALDGIGGGLMFWALGLPSPVMWGIVMFVLSILPLFGTWLISIPVATYLLLTGDWVEGAILLTWGIVSSAIVSNIIYFRVAGDRMRLHQVPVFVAFLGGLFVFGPSGVILGPAILSITVALLEVWRRRTADPDPIATPGEIEHLVPTQAAAAT